MAQVATSDARSTQLLQNHSFPSKIELEGAAKRLGQLTPTHVKAGIIKNSEIIDIRAKVHDGITLYKLNLPKNTKGLRQYLAGYPHVSECHCTSGLNRTQGEDNGREKLETTISGFAAKTLKTQGIRPYLISVGSGSLAQELQVCQSLADAGVTDFKLVLADSLYKDNSSMKPGCKQEMVHEFLTLLHVGLGLNITAGLGDSKSCATVNNAIKSFKKSALYQEDKTKNGSAEISFFPTADAYLRDVKPNQQRPNIVFDSDFKSDINERNQIMNGPLKASDTTTLYISLGKYSRFHDTQSTHVDLETKTKINGRWNESNVVPIAVGSCKH